MSDLLHLAKSVVESPHEETVKGVLADALDEAHPHNRDVRAELLRTPQNVDPIKDIGYFGQHARNVQGLDPKDQYRIRTVFGTTSGYPRAPLIGIHVDGPYPQSSSKFIRVSHEKAREVADGLPYPDEIHKYLDQHFGPDPRTEKFARKYSTALKRTE